MCFFYYFIAKAFRFFLEQIHQGLNRFEGLRLLWCAAWFIFQTFFEK